MLTITISYFTYKCLNTILNINKTLFTQKYTLLHKSYVKPFINREGGVDGVSNADSKCYAGALKYNPNRTLTNLSHFTSFHPQ